jgi:hypothetical protein
LEDFVETTITIQEREKLDLIIASEANALDINTRLEAVKPAAGVTTAKVRARALNGLDGKAPTVPITMECAVFDDADGAVLSATSTLATASRGTILAGEGTAAMKVKTDAQGVFECTLSLVALAPAARYFSAFATPTGPYIDAVGSVAVDFTV